MKVIKDKVSINIAKAYVIDGGRARRAAWLDPNAYLYCKQEPVTGVPKTKKYTGIYHLYSPMHEEFHGPYTPNQDDRYAKDWQLLD